jgi:Predicted membrane protein
MTTAPNFTPGQEAQGKVPALIAWALYILSIPSANLLVLVGLIVAYASRGSATGVPRQHIDAQIRLFWSVFWWTIAAWVGIAISIPLAFLVVGVFTGLAFALALLVLHIWFTVKSILGLIQLLQNRPV